MNTIGLHFPNPYLFPGVTWKRWGRYCLSIPDIATVLFNQNGAVTSPLLNMATSVTPICSPPFADWDLGHPCSVLIHCLFPRSIILALTIQTRILSSSLLKLFLRSRMFNGATVFTIVKLTDTSLCHHPWQPQEEHDSPDVEEVAYQNTFDPPKLDCSFGVPH